MSMVQQKAPTSQQPNTHANVFQPISPRIPLHIHVLMGKLGYSYYSFPLFIDKQFLQGGSFLSTAGKERKFSNGWVAVT